MKQEQYIHIDQYGNKFVYKDKAMTKLHRTDGPAVERAHGTKAWYVDGQCHRTDGHAIETFNGSKFWYVDGKRHRIDGPAIEYADGFKEWYVDGESLTEKEFKALTKPTELTLEDIAAKFGIDINNLKIVK